VKCNDSLDLISIAARTPDKHADNWIICYGSPQTSIKSHIPLPWPDCCPQKAAITDLGRHDVRTLFRQPTHNVNNRGPSLILTVVTERVKWYTNAKTRSVFVLQVQWSMDTWPLKRSDSHRAGSLRSITGIKLTYECLETIISRGDTFYCCGPRISKKSPVDSKRIQNAVVVIAFPIYGENGNFWPFEWVRLTKCSVG
jgi:hypothetical protein